MKWMWSIAMVAAAVSCAAASQAAGEMKHPAMAMESTTYTGCVESINHGARYMLTHVGNADMGATKHDDMAMKHDDMAMKHDDMAMKHDDMAMKHDDMAMKHDDMMAKDGSAFVLAGGPDLRKFVGKKVSVAGSVSKPAQAMHDEAQTLTVTSVKVVGKACS